MYSTFIGFSIPLSRSGSSLLGELLSLSPSASYYYEPLWQHNLACSARHNSSLVLPLLEDTLAR